MVIHEALGNPPGPRYRRQGAGSGEGLREDHLIPALDRARAQGGRVEVDADGTPYGYPASFLEEAFGGLVRRRGAAAADQIAVRCSDDPEMEPTVTEVMRDAAARDRRQPA